MERKSFQQHPTLSLTHNFIVPGNVLMRQNVFSIEQILAGICELFTGSDKLAYSAIELARSIRRSRVARPCCAVNGDFSLSRSWCVADL